MVVDNSYLSTISILEVANKNYLSHYPDTDDGAYKYIRDNFSGAVKKMFSEKNYGAYNLDTLFTEWNVWTDLKINTSTGATSYGNVEGSDLKDIIFLTSEQNDIRVESGKGNDEIFGNKDYQNNINSGQGGDYVIAGNKNDYVNSGTDSDTSADKNFVYLGKGSDIFYGGDGIDIVDGGTGNKLEGDSNNNYQSLSKDNENNVNTISLGGGNDKYYGSDGDDDVDSEAA